MKYIIHILLIFSLTACSSSPLRYPDFNGDRELASNEDCKSLLSKFVGKDPSVEELNAALKERKLISFKDKLIILSYPKIDWISDSKKKLINRMKAWNRNKYPLFYLDSDEEIYPLAKSYAGLITKEASGTLDDESKKSLETISSWINLYKSYQTDLDNLLDERISLQYNFNILKEIKLSKNETRDIKVTLKVNGEFVSDVITLRSEDHNLKYVMETYRDRIKELDGALNGVGRIHERVIKQALSKDVLTIVQRELEHAVKNTDNAIPELVAHLDELNSVLANTIFEPSSFGVYKITNQVFKTEMADLFHMPTVVKKVKSENHLTIRQHIEKFFGKNPISSSIDESIKETKDAVGDVVHDTVVDVAKILKDSKTPAKDADIKKEGPLKRIYAKISTLTPYQKFMVTTKLAFIGYGAYRFFWFKKSGEVVEITAKKKKPENSDNNKPVSPDEADHEQQLETTQKLEEEKSKGHSSVIEIHLENLKNTKPNVN